MQDSRAASSGVSPKSLSAISRGASAVSSATSSAQAERDMPGKERQSRRARRQQSAQRAYLRHTIHQCDFLISFATLIPTADKPLFRTSAADADAAERPRTAETKPASPISWRRFAPPHCSASKTVTNPATQAALATNPTNNSIPRRTSCPIERNIAHHPLQLTPLGQLCARRPQKKINDLLMILHERFILDR